MDFVAAIASLERSHNEVPVWRGRSSKGTMIVLFEAAETRTWTVLIVMPNGRACPADAGGLAERLEKEKKVRQDLIDAWRDYRSKGTQFQFAVAAIVIFVIAAFALCVGGDHGGPVAGG